jgi:hypothetical protein
MQPLDGHGNMMMMMDGHGMCMCAVMGMPGIA